MKREMVAVNRTGKTLKRTELPHLGYFNKKRDGCAGDFAINVV
jgi:hypothetical protein